MPKYIAHWNAESEQLKIPTWDGVCTSPMMLRMYGTDFNRFGSHRALHDYFVSIAGRAGVVYNQRPEVTYVYDDSWTS